MGRRDDACFGFEGAWTFLRLLHFPTGPLTKRLFVLPIETGVVQHMQKQAAMEVALACIKTARLECVAAWQSSLEPRSSLLRQRISLLLWQFRSRF